jgi:hypothetical protein
VTGFLSFKKQLSNYEFKRITRGTYLDHYYHSSFTRGDLSAVQTMQPKPVIRRNRSAANKENIPDFQNIPTVMDWQALLTPICSNNNSQDSFYQSENSAPPYSPPLLTSLDHNDYSQGSYYYDYNCSTPLVTHSGGNEYSQLSNNNNSATADLNMNSSDLSEFDDILFAST